MTKEDYIFKDTSFEGRPRVKWITDCLLGDIQTFLDGIESYTDNEEIFAFGSHPRGGGNLSVPILINTTLEFVAALHAGKTKYMENVSYNATDNAREFIKAFFSEKYRQIPLLLWDGVRNGLVHSFYPKSFSYQGSDQFLGYVRFKFYVKNRNHSSYIEKDNDTIWITINVFELYRVLKNAIEEYLNELKHDETLQDKFKEAWSSIEGYSDKADSNQSGEIEVLLDYLDSSPTAPIMEDL